MNFMKIYMNDKLVDQSEAMVSVFDHGLLYGDGIFEGIRLYEGCVFKLEEHLERLEYSAKAVMLDLPWSRAEIAAAVCETCRANGLTNGYIRLVVTRGVGSLGLSIKNCDRPQLIIIADKIQLYPAEFYEQGLEIITVPTRRTSSAALPPTVKSLNYLNNILAKIEAQHLGYHEAIMLNDQGFVAECTGDNIFIIKNNNLITPPAYLGILKGITRACVMDIAEKKDMAVKEEVITRHNIFTADECFLTGTAAEIIPVVCVDKRVIGDGKPGEITLNLMKEFRKATKTDGIKY